MQKATGVQPLTTFVETDTNTFKEVVQRLTGPSESKPIQIAASVISKAAARLRRPTPKLHERRHYTRLKLEILKPCISFKSNVTSPSSRGLSIHPSPLATPSNVFSKLTLQEERVKDKKVLDLNYEEEEKALRKRSFYLHPSPSSRPGSDEFPELFTLFPLTPEHTTQYSK